MRTLTNEQKVVARKKAASFWDTDLKDIEPQQLYNSIETVKLSTPDSRIPPQGSVLLGKPAYLPRK